MVDFVCENTEIRKTLIDLHTQVQSNGGFVHDKLTVISTQGDFKIRVADDVPLGEKILMLPRQCLLPADKFTLGLEDNEILIKAHDREVSSAQVGMMETMIALYNLTEKIATQKRISTLLLYHEDRALFDMLLGGRSKEGISSFEEMVAQEENDFCLGNFIKTRVLGFKEEGRGESEPFRIANVFMPIIDFLNHHPEAAGFVRRMRGRAGASSDENLGQESVTILNYCPGPDHKECFVNYGPYDAMDSLLHYNYTERNAGFVRSVPLTCTIPGRGTVNIRSAVGRVDFKVLPEKLRDIKFYIPGITKDEGKNVVELSFLYIPLGNAPRSMRRVLALALNQLGVGMEDPERMQFIRLLESQVIHENLKYFTGLLDYLASCKPKPALTSIVGNVQEMAKHQLVTIGSYPFFAEALAMRGR
jgi:hypothetical protein